MDIRLQNRAKQVYFYLCDRMNKERIAWPAINTIAKDCSISRSTVKGTLIDLENTKYIKKDFAYRAN